MTDTLSGALTDFGHVLPVRVYYEDTDFTGIVYHARYLQFFERGRTDFLRLKGISHRALEEGGFGVPLAFAVASMDIQFKRPARIDDVLTVETRLQMIKGARLVMEQRLMLEGVLSVKATVTIAVIDLEGRAQRVPPQIVKAFAPVS